MNAHPPLGQDDIIVALLTHHAFDIEILKAGQRVAAAQGCPLYVVLIDDDTENEIEPKHLNSFVDQSSPYPLLRLAESMKATVDIISFKNKKDAIQIYFFTKIAKGHRINTLVFSEDAPYDQSRHDDIVTEVKKAVGLQTRFINVTLPIEKRKSIFKKTFDEFLNDYITPLVGSLICSFAGIGIPMIVQQFLASEGNSLKLSHTFSFLLIVLFANISAIHFGLLAGLTTVAISCIAATYQYMEPFDDLRINNYADFFDWILLISVSSTTAILSALIWRQNQTSIFNQKQMQTLVEMSTMTLYNDSRELILQDIRKRLVDFLNVDVMLFLPSVVYMHRVEAAWEELYDFTATDQALVQECWHALKESVIGQTFSNAETGWRFVPLSTLYNDMGILALRPNISDKSNRTFTISNIKKLADLSAYILERSEMKTIDQEQRIRKEKNRLRHFIVSSVSHDLRTPLASIIGSLSLHRSDKVKLSSVQRTELINTAFVEANRLDSFISNILGLAKLESGQTTLTQEWRTLSDLIDKALTKIHWRLQADRIDTSAVHDKEIFMDMSASTTALVNLLDNACKYSPDGSSISFSTEMLPEGLALNIHDQGPGISPDHFEKIFDKDARMERKDASLAGTGLSLALSRALMQLQKGDVRVRNHIDGGAIFTLIWPEYK